MTPIHRFRFQPTSLSWNVFSNYSNLPALLRFPVPSALRPRSLAPTYERIKYLVGSV